VVGEVSAAVKSFAQELLDDLRKIHPPIALTTREFVRKKMSKKGTPNDKKGPKKPGKDPTKKKGK
jgi:hypothetical protein